jgi:hypothetical protein
LGFSKANSLPSFHYSIIPGSQIRRIGRHGVIGTDICPEIRSLRLLSMREVHGRMSCLPEIEVEHPKVDDRRYFGEIPRTDYRKGGTLGLHHL